MSKPDLVFQANINLLYHEEMERRYRLVMYLPEWVTIMCATLALADQTELISLGFNLTPLVMFVALLIYTLSLALRLKDQFAAHYATKSRWQDLIRQAELTQEDSPKWPELGWRFHQIMVDAPPRNFKRFERTYDAVRCRMGVECDGGD